MKTNNLGFFFLTFALFSLISPTVSEAQYFLRDTIKVSSLQERRAIIKSNFTGVLVTNRSQSYQLENYKNGKLEGTRVLINGDFTKKLNYKNGKLHGRTTQTKKGQLLEQYDYQYGKILSQHKWDTLGQILVKDDLKTTGHYSNFYPNGQLRKIIMPLEDNKSTEKWFSENGTPLLTINHLDTIFHRLNITEKGEIIKEKKITQKSAFVPESLSGLAAEWGKGVIENWYFWKTEAATQNFEILTYNKPYGQVNGKLLNSNNRLDFNALFLESGIRPLDERDGTFVAAYKTEFFFKYYEERNGYLRILHYSSPEETIWIRKADLPEKISPISWTDFAAKSIVNLVVLNNYSLNVRSGPGVSYKKIYNHKAIKSGGAFEEEKRTILVATGQTSGRWIEVKGYQGLPCEFNAIKKNHKWEFTGWIKATDDSGFPNIFREYCGC